MAKVLFVTKLRHVYGYANTLSSGLFNSARFVADMLVANGVEAKVVQVVDNNSIDKEVHDYQPTHVFIEALWVVPEKMEVLVGLYPKIKWVLRLHSNTPFIACEGMFADWIHRYPKSVEINCNGHEMFGTLKYLLGPDRVSYLPNYYPVSHNFDRSANYTPHHKYLNVGCFGAIRPLKNQLIQAVAAAEFADSIGRRLRFHINASRVEGGNAVLKNLRHILKAPHQLIEVPWLSHDRFIVTVRQMDLGMQVSFTETFNIVAADMVNANVPTVVSKQMGWASRLYMADPTSTDSIVSRLRAAWRLKGIEGHALNKVGLCRYAADSQKQWLAYLA